MGSGLTPGFTVPRLNSMTSTADMLLLQAPAKRECANRLETTGSSVRDDLASLVRLVEASCQHCDHLSHNAFVAASSDAQRDLLHMRARIEGIGRQVRDTIATFNRLLEHLQALSDRSQPSIPIRFADRDVPSMATWVQHLPSDGLLRCEHELPKTRDQKCQV